jgi:hypothetical protein
MKPLVEIIIFHVLKAPTPFLIYFQNIYWLKVSFNNIINKIAFANSHLRALIIRKCGHFWFFVSKLENATFLTNGKLKHLHHYFGYSATDKLCILLKRVNHENYRQAFIIIEKFCYYCQIKNLKPRRFKFIFRNDCEFNHETFVDVLYLIFLPVSQVVD